MATIFENDLKKLTLSPDIFSESAYFEIPNKFMIDKNTNWSVKFIVNELLNQKGEQVAEPMAFYEVGSNFGSSSSINDNKTFTIDLLNKEDNKLYKAKGVAVLKIVTNTNAIEIDANVVDKTILFEGINYKVVKNNKNVLILESDKTNDTHTFDFIHANGKRFSNYGIMTFTKENKLFEIFKKFNKELNLAEREQIAKTISLDDYAKEQNKNELGPVWKLINLNDVTSKILISGTTKSETFEFPFEVRAEGIKLIDKKIAFKDFGKNKELFRNPDTDQAFDDDEDFQEITSVDVGVYDLENSNKSQEEKLFALNSSLPTEILKFKNLEKLRIRLSNKSNLEAIFEVLSKLEYLTELHLAGLIDEETIDEPNFNTSHTLFSIPKNIEKLTKLEILNLEGNLLRTLPIEIAKLSKLHTLKLSNNYLRDIPQAILKCESLTNLDLSDNFIDKIPSEFCQLTKITNLNVANNQLENFPLCILKNKEIDNINVAGNFLSKFWKLPTTFKPKTGVEGIDSQAEKSLLQENQVFKQKKALLLFYKQ